MRVVRKLFVIALVALIGFAIGRFYQTANKTEIKWELVDALPKRLSHCVLANIEEAKIYNLAVTVLESTGSANENDRSVLWLDIGAQKFLSHGIYRTENKKSIPVCPPAGVYERVGDTLTKYKLLQGRLVEYGLELAAKLPQPSPYVIKAVANSAFNNTPQESEIFKLKDIRPYARTVLAGFGAQTSPYADQAYQQISASDSLGTGAAQVAVAAGHPDALPRVETLMHGLLSSVPKHDVIPWKIRNRLYELAYAIRFADKEGQKYTAPIKELMSRKVQSSAPPFGMIELNPKRMCQVLEDIEGKAPLKDYTYCNDDKIPYEQ